MPNKNKIGQLGRALLLISFMHSAMADSPPPPEVLGQASTPVIQAEKGYLLSVSRAGNRLVAVGAGGRIILSDDHGVTWRQAVVPVNVLLTQVRFVNDEEGWAIGHLGVVLHTANGGQTWKVQLNGVGAAKLFLEQAQREISQAGDQDEGASRALRQAQSLVEDGPDKPFLTMHIQDAKHVTVFGAFGIALRSADGGETWAPLPAQDFNPNSLHYYGSSVSLGQDLVVGEQGLVVKGDGNGHYQPITQPYAGTLFGVVMNKSAVLAFGLRGNAVRSLDQGQTWQHVDTGVSASIQGGIELKDERFLLFAENGQAILVNPRADHFQSIHQQLAPATEAVQINDHDFVLVGPSGVQTLSLAIGDNAP